MKKFVKKMMVVGAITTLSASTVYGNSKVELNELRFIDLTKVLNNSNSSNSSNNISSNEENANTNNTNSDTDGLNTNIDDIKAMSFYSTTLSSNENAVDVAEGVLKSTPFTQTAKPQKGDLVAIVETSEGTIKVKLLPEVAPKAVKNFVDHSLNGYYDGVTFHRVIDNFVVQGGDPNGTGRGGESVWGKPFSIEVNPSARHFSGALAMANSGGTATNGSQFYFVDNVELTTNEKMQMSYLGENQEAILHGHEINDGEDDVYHEGDMYVKDVYPKEVIDSYQSLGGVPYLDFSYTVFGQTYEGLDVIDKITQVPVNQNDKPIQPVIIEKITIGIVE